MKATANWVCPIPPYPRRITILRWDPSTWNASFIFLSSSSLPTNYSISGTPGRLKRREKIFFSLAWATIIITNRTRTIMSHTLFFVILWILLRSFQRASIASGAFSARSCKCPDTFSYRTSLREANFTILRWFAGMATDSASAGPGTIAEACNTRWIR